jgi:hypothetical protein
MKNAFPSLTPDNLCNSSQYYINTHTLKFLAKKQLKKQLLISLSLFHIFLIFVILRTRCTHQTFRANFFNLIANHRHFSNYE